MPNERPPYPENKCIRCDEGEELIVSPYSSIVGIAAIHAPSTNICSKYIKPEVLKAMEIAYEKRKAR